MVRIDRMPGWTLVAAATGLVLLVVIVSPSHNSATGILLGFAIAAVLAGAAWIWRRWQRRRDQFLPDLPVPLQDPRKGTPSQDDLIHSTQMESLGILAGGIAHDFNNLLTGILGNTNLALAELPPGSARDAVLEADIAARRARELVAQILAYSGRGRLELKSIDLAALSRETASLLHHVLSPKARVTVDASDVARIEADPAQVRQVVMNLLTNASDALGNAPGDVSLRVCRERMSREQLDRTTLGRDLPIGRYVRVEVKDTGCGMDQATRVRMFEPYFTTKYTGRGLGLAALLGIVRHHRGTLHVHSSPGEGTTVTVWFPAADTIDTTTDGSEPPRQSIRIGTILLAEDEEMVRRVAVRMLSKLGYDVVAVCDGDEAIAALRDGDCPFTLALLDVRMPGTDGREVLQHIRKHHPMLPAILMTGYAGRDSAGDTPDGIVPDAWLRKPFSLRELVDVLDQTTGSSTAIPAGVREVARRR